MQTDILSLNNLSQYEKKCMMEKGSNNPQVFQKTLLIQVVQQLYRK